MKAVWPKQVAWQSLSSISIFMMVHQRRRYSSLRTTRLWWIQFQWNLPKRSDVEEVQSRRKLNWFEAYRLAKSDESDNTLENNTGPVKACKTAFLLKYFKGLRAIRIDGTTPSKVREEQCRVFQNNEDVVVAVLSMTAAGIGVTLTAASVVVFAELHWNPGVGTRHGRKLWNLMFHAMCSNTMVQGINLRTLFGLPSIRSLFFCF